MDTQGNKTKSLSLFLKIRNGVYTICGFLNDIFPNRNPKIAIYCYHSISDDGWRFSVTKEDFQQQIETLLKNKTPISIHELSAYIREEKKLEGDAFVVTFDDGYEDILQVKDFLKQHNVFPTVFVLSDTEKANYKELSMRRKFLDKSQILALKESGWQIGSHSATHPDFAHLTGDEIVKEVLVSKKDLENKLGFSIGYFAYPKGSYTPEILKTVHDAGYVLAFSMNDGYVTKDTDRFLIPRVGVDGTHTMRQFVNLTLPFSMMFRKVLKKIV